MKATIKTYQCNATVFFNDNAIDINWDGLEFDAQYEYAEWVAGQLAPIADADNYPEVRTRLEIATDQLRPSSARQRALDTVYEWDVDDLNGMVVRAHSANSHEWVECMPDGTVHDTEEADNNSSHWIDYPNKAVASIYEICAASGAACDCDICTMYRHFEDMDKDEFIVFYSEEDWNYCNENSLDDAILDFERENDGLTGEAIREQMIDAIKEIEYGYFEDED